MWRLLGASVAGTAHQRAGLTCQDAHGYVRRGDLALLAVADGAGSAERAAEGAGQAVMTALEVLAPALAAGWPADDSAWPIVFGRVFLAAQQAVAALAAEHGLPARAFASTLQCIVAGPQGLAAAQVGDGLAVVAQPGGGWLLVVPPVRGEYANETTFLTQSGILDQLPVYRHPGPVEAVVASTDGLLRLVLDVTSGAPHVPFFKPLLAFAGQTETEAHGAAELAAFLASERVCARTDDDKTLVIAHRGGRQPA